MLLLLFSMVIEFLTEKLLQVDNFILHCLKSIFDNRIFNPISSFFSLSASPLFLSFLFLFLFFLKNSLRSLLFLYVFSILCVSMVVAILKYLFKRPRPKNPLNSDFPSQSSFYSFPSGHVSRLSAITFSHIIWPLTLILLLWTLCVCVARILEEEHWPSDVIGGFFVGGVCSCVGYIMFHIFLSLFDLSFLFELPSFFP